MRKQVKNQYEKKVVSEKFPQKMYLLSNNHNKKTKKKAKKKNKRKKRKSSQ